jgi:hypothetical protein
LGRGADREDPPAIDHPATSLGLRCAIAIRPSAIFFQKTESDLTGGAGCDRCFQHQLARGALPYLFKTPADNTPEQNDVVYE